MQRKPETKLDRKSGCPRFNAPASQNERAFKNENAVSAFNAPASQLVVGLMSGTSVDGIDACLVRVHPDFSTEFIAGILYPYPEKIRDKIFDIFKGKTSVEEICWMNFVLGEYFAEAALKVIEKAGLTPEKVDLIGSHGQTIFHKPEDDFIEGFNKKSTLQIGEASVIAERTGITTVADFRTADIAAGGQGAPLVCFADEIMFKEKGKTRAIQNIGGMSNVTVVGGERAFKSENAVSTFNAPASQVETFAFDIGPGNVIIDYCADKFFGKPYDKDGKFAREGKVDNAWLEKLLEDPYYSRKPPKTTGRELFTPEYIENLLKSAPENPYDIIATATALTAKTIANAYKDFIFPKTKVDELIVGGGGGFNPALMNMLKEDFAGELKILKHEDFGISDEFKEAIAFAMLAYATYYKIPNNIPTCTGAKHSTILGKISYM